MNLRKLDYPRIVLWIVQVSYLWLGAMAIYFYHERLAPDTSYYFFKSLNSQYFHIEHQRWVLGIAEFPVVILSRFHAPLTLIMMVYSVWHLFFFYLIGLIIYLRYRQVFAWLLLLLLQLVGVRYGFTCPIFEQFYGTAIAILFFVMLGQKESVRNINIILQLILWVLLIGSHPFNIILGCFLLTLDFSETRNWKKYIPYLIVLPLFLVYKKMNASSYESDKVSWIFDVEHNKTFEHLFQIDYYRQAGIYLWKYYKDLIMLGLGWVLFCLLTRRWFVILTSVVFVAGTLLLVNFSYTMTEYSGYNEQLYFILAPLILVPILLIIFPLCKQTWSTTLVILGLVFLISIHSKDQFEEATRFQIRTQLVNEWIKTSQTLPGNKFYINQRNYPKASCYLGWDITYFSLLLSAEQGSKKQVSIINLEENPSTSLLQVGKNTFYFRPGEKMATGALNRNYFSLTASTFSYSKLE